MNEKIEHRIEQLTSNFSQIKQLDHDNLSHLYELVSLHNESMFIVGDLVSEALQVRDTAYLERKREYAEIVLMESGTVAEKQARAELAIVGHRKDEASANSMYHKYKHMYESLNHKLIDLRQKRNKLEDELTLINDRG